MGWCLDMCVDSTFLFNKERVGLTESNNTGWDDYPVPAIFACKESPNAHIR